ncbi:GHKL domain-containing protein [Clostridiales bacterium FE2011]|nr:GHKL domain-containing protein [Clostridiales bacterium FE2011]QTE75645.1 GHKL domain-containing protein [Clostridiales bacterium FE2010]
MIWLLYIIDLVGNVLEELIAVSYFRFISGEKSKSRKVLIVVCVSLALLRMIPYFTMDGEYPTMIATILSIFFISLFYNLSWIKRLIFIPLLFILIAISELLTGLLMTTLTGIPLNEGMNMILFSAGAIMISRMVMFSLLKIIQYMVPSFGEKIPGYLMWPLLMLPVATFLMACPMAAYSFSEGPSDKTLSATCAVILLALTNVALFLLIEHQQKEEREKNRFFLEQQLTEEKMSYYRELTERQQISNKTMHDLKNQMFALTEAIKSEPNRTREIIESIAGKIFAASPMTVTGIESVDALIFSKKQKMELYGIRYSESVHYSPGCTFDPMDLCILLGNLLDNAIEANNKVKGEDRFVSLTMMQQERWLSITVKNAAVETTIIDENTIHTTKELKELHGFGLKSIREITDRYQGNCTFSYENGEFIAYVFLQDA